MLIMQASGPNPEQNGESESDEEEQIYVARQEEERDPEAEAEFDREFEKMMAESYESRRFERKGAFDIPLPMKRTGRDTAAESAESSQPPNTMAFSLMTKKGNKQQVRSQLTKPEATYHTLTRLTRPGPSIYHRTPASRLP